MGTTVPAGRGHERRILDVVFALLLATGLVVGTVFLLAVGDWLRPQGEDAFGIYILAMLSLVPTCLAWLASGIQSFRGTRDPDVRLGALLTTGHLVWWVAAVALLMRLSPSAPSGLVAILVLEVGCYAVATTVLALRWFRGRRRAMPA